MLYRGLAVFIFGFILGCAHFLRRDPRVDPALLPPTEEMKLQQPEPANARWLRLFREGEAAQNRGERETACLRYRELQADHAFPLWELALIRAHQACPFTEDLSVPWAAPSELTIWFADEILKAKQAEWSRMGPAEKIPFLWDKAAAEKDDRQRELFLIDALSMAESAEPSLAEDARRRLWKNSPRLIPAPKKSELAAVAGDLRRWREFDRSVALERKRLKDPGLTDDERFALLKSIRQTYKTAQRKTEMMAATEELRAFARQSFRKARDGGGARRFLEAQILFARTVWTENQRGRAEQALLEAEKELAGKASLEELHFVLGRLREESGDLAAAEASFAAALQDPPAVGGLKEKIRWARGWVLHKAGRREEAVTAFDDMAANAKEPGDRVRASFWSARNISDGERRAKAMADVMKQDPLGFYGLMAARDLQAPLSPLKPGSAAPAAMLLTSSPDVAPRPALAAEWTIALELKEPSLRILDGLQSDVKKNSRAANETWLRVAGAYARAGQYLPLFSLIGTLPAATRDALLQDHPELLFPQRWRADVEAAASAAGIPPELLLSIVRQESAFDPRARSHAEAYGLTQLLPSVAAAHARRHGIPYKNPDDLFDPKLALPLGAWELRTLFDRWQGQWIPSIASYNASADAVRGWLKFRRRPDPVEFIEEIPYEETRAYVKLVMRNQVFYQRLLSEKPTLFPESCLALKEPKD